jgi:hypothetical protein
MVTVTIYELSTWVTGALSQHPPQQHATLQHITDPQMAVIASTTAKNASTASMAIVV